jgi:hypothetical protein
VSRHVEVNNASPIMRQNNKDEQNLKPDGVNREKVDRSELAYVIVEKRSPSLRWWFWTLNHVFGSA